MPDFDKGGMGMWSRAVDKVDITPQMIRDDVLFTYRRSWSGRIGYDENEVDDFLDRTADKMEVLMQENNAFRQALLRAGLSHSEVEAIAENRLVHTTLTKKD